MRRHPLLLIALVSGAALAWAPRLDERSAKAVIDTAYNRASQPVRTLLSVDLSLKDGAFAAGPNAVRVFDGDAACLTNWTQNPTAYAQNGSRPNNITITGQADELFLQAQQARDTFKNLTVPEALARYQTPNAASGAGSTPSSPTQATSSPTNGASAGATAGTAGAATGAQPQQQPQQASNVLPEGHLRVYVGMTGLESERLRDAYNVALRTADGKLVQPYRRAFTNDWKQTEGGRFGGTMVYYFDAAKAGVTANAKLDVLLRTEADTNCAYAVPVDLGTFY